MQIPKTNFEATLLRMLHEKCVTTNPWFTTRDLVELKEFIQQINKEVIDCYNTLKSNMDYGIFLPIQYAGIEALRHGGASIHSTCQAYQDRRDAICEAFDEVGWHIDKSPATMFAWARIPDQYEDSYAFTKDLLEKTGINTPTRFRQMIR